MRSLAVAPGLVAMILVVGQPAAPPTRTSDATSVDVTGSSIEPDRELRLWRGKAPHVCLVRECERPEPTFCLVGRSLGADAMTPQLEAKQICDRQPRFRDALRGPRVGAPTPPIPRTPAPG